MHTDEIRLLLIGFPAKNITMVAALKCAHYSTYVTQTPQCEPLPAMVLIDIPSLGNASIVRLLRAWTQAPIVVLSEDPDAFGIIRFLDAGADDCMLKPIIQGELLARMRAIWRRSFRDAETVIETGPIRLHLDRREAFVNSAKVRLTKTEYSLLTVLAADAGKISTHQSLIREVWGSTQYRDVNHLMRVTVSNLRRKLKVPVIETATGSGYRLISPTPMQLLTPAMTAEA